MGVVNYWSHLGLTDKCCLATFRCLPLLPWYIRETAETGLNQLKGSCC